MDGDFCPLKEMINLFEQRIPEQARHIFIDEAHSHGILGPQGQGMAAALGVAHQIHTRMMPFSKGHNFAGGEPFSAYV
jgi:8-amino-7-oxononanoate synthase